jgi:dUTP pyrophosphatase
MVIRVKKLSPEAQVPQYQREDDAACDLHATGSVEIPVGEGRGIGTGLAFEIPKGYVGLVRDRSGLAFKQNLTTFGGVIDPGYRGELKVYLHNAGKEPYTVEKGERIAQFLFMPVEHVTFEEADELSESDRSDAAFGSSGKT